MVITQRWLMIMSLGATLTVSALQLDRNSAESFVKDAKEVVLNLQVLQASVLRREDLKTQGIRVGAAMKMKEDWARAVLDRRLTLVEAARKFASTDFRVHYDWDYLKKTNPEMAFETRCGHYVVDTIEFILALESGQSSEASATFRAAVRSWETP